MERKKSLRTILRIRRKPCSSSRPRESAEQEQDRLHESLTESILGAAINVHRALGPGLLESVTHISAITPGMNCGLWG